MTYRAYRPTPSARDPEEKKGFAGLQHRKPTPRHKERAGNASKERARGRELDRRLDELLGPVEEEDE